MNKILSSLLLLTLLLSSCAVFQSDETRAQNHLKKAISLDPSIAKSTTKDSLRIRDSVSYVEKVRIRDSFNLVTKDSTIIVPKTDITGSVTKPCDSLGVLKDFDYTFGAGANKLRIWAVDGVLYYRSSVDSLVSTIKSRDSYVLHLEDSLRALVKDKQELRATQERQTITITKNHYTFLQILGFGLVIFVAGFVCGKLLKVQIPLLG